jgi:hypothetical protein
MSRAAAAGVGLDGLAVREHHDQQQQGDQHGDGLTEAEGTGTADHQDPQHLFGGVGDGRQGIGGQDGESAQQAKAMVFSVIRRDRAADDQPLQGCKHGLSTPPARLAAGLKGGDPCRASRTIRPDYWVPRSAAVGDGFGKP